jgi:hypothetical protein
LEEMAGIVNQLVGYISVDDAFIVSFLEKKKQ